MGRIVKTIMAKGFMLFPFYFFTFLPLAAQNTLPKETAAHFCRLLVNDDEGHVCTISNYIRTHQTATSDSLTLQQLFTTYVFQYEGWKTLRIFPHCTEGSVKWYAATDALPSDLDHEHQKYIREVFPRLATEVEAGNWTQVDAYINRMEQYQCRFGSSSPSTFNTPLATHIPWIAVLLFLFFLFGPVLIIKRPLSPAD